MMDNFNVEDNGTPKEDNSHPDNNQGTDVDWKKRYSDSSREAKKLAEEKKRLEKLYEEDLPEYHQKVVADNTVLLKLSKENPEVAEKVAKMFGLTLDKAIRLIKQEKGEDKSSALDVDEITEIAKKKVSEELTKKEAEKTVNKFFKNIPEDIRDEVEAKYKKLSRHLSGYDIEEIEELLETSLESVQAKNKKQTNSDERMLSYSSGMPMKRADSPKRVSSEEMSMAKRFLSDDEFKKLYGK